MSDTRSEARLRSGLPRPCHERVLGPAWRLALGDLTLAGLAVALALWPTAFELVDSWQRNGAYHYAWLVTPMFVYLVGWHYRAQILAETPHPDAAGVILAVVAALGWSVAAAANIAIGRQLALLAVFQGLALAALGRRLYRQLLPVMALLFLMLPSGDLLLGPLRRLTVKVIEWFALASGMPFRSEGFLLHVGKHAYVVLEACAGLAYVTLTLFLGYCFAVLVFRSMYRIVALAFCAAALGVLSNVLRVDTIVWIDQLRASPMDLAAHGWIQWLILSVVLALLFYGMWRVQPEPVALAQAMGNAGKAARPARPSSGLTRRAPLVAGVAVLAIVGGARAVLDDDDRAVPVVPEWEAPAVPAGWELDLPTAVWGEAGDLRYLDLRYRRAGRRLDVTLVEARRAGAKLMPERVLPDSRSGWYDVARESLLACPGNERAANATEARAGCVHLNHSIWKNDDTQGARHVYYGYTVGRFQTDSRLLVRLAAAASRLGGDHATTRLTAFSVAGDALEPDELYATYGALAVTSYGAGD